MKLTKRSRDRLLATVWTNRRRLLGHQAYHPTHSVAALLQLGLDHHFLPPLLLLNALVVFGSLSDDAEENIQELQPLKTKKVTKLKHW